jgi:hypothetical protein
MITIGDKWQQGKTHEALGIDQAVSCELLDGLVDAVDDVRVTNLGDDATIRALLGETDGLNAESTGAVPDELMVASGLELPGAITCDVGRDSPAVLNFRGAACGLVLKGAGVAVADALCVALDEDDVGTAVIGCSRRKRDGFARGENEETQNGQKLEENRLHDES